MKYIRLEKNVVQEIIPAIDPVFPDFTIEERYPAAFLAMCVPVEDVVEVQQNFEHIPKTGEFKPQITITYKIDNSEVAVWENTTLEFYSNTDGAFSYAAENCTYENGVATPVGVGACCITATFTAVDGRAKVETVFFQAIERIEVK